MLARAGGLREAADYKFFFLVDFYLQPFRGPALGISGQEIFTDDAFQATARSNLKGLNTIAGKPGGQQKQRCGTGDAVFQTGAADGQRFRPEIAAVEGETIEDFELRL